MGFRKAQVLLKTAPGAYVRGEWVEGAPVATTLYASIQPAIGQELLVLPEGLRTRATVKVYTDQELNTSENGQSPDRIEWQGHVYEIAMKAPYQSGVINHFKYFATKIQAPNDAA